MDNAPQIMTFRPTMEEFRDMIGFIKYMESQGAHEAGIARIIPPKEWKPVKDYSFFESEKFNSFVVEAPIRQDLIGDKGIGLSVNQIVKSQTVGDFRKMANDKKYAPPMDFFDFEDLERKYWSNLNYEPAIYGADVSGSLSDADLEYWNIAHLPGVLNMLSKDGPIPGVTTPYLYYGMWKAGFAWHTEDLDLYSINYIHYGAPKQWYSVPPKYGWKLEALARGLFHTEYSKCKQFLRHKQCFISPPTLKENNVPVRKVVQECGEIIITFPYGYHSGFNMGFNVAESTNFATERWIIYGLAAKVCRCKDDTVRINMEPFVKKYLSDEDNKKFKSGEPFIHPEDPNANAIMRRNEACSRKRKRAMEQDLEKQSVVDSGDKEDPPQCSADTSAPPEKMVKTTGCGRRRLVFTVDDESDVGSVSSSVVPTKETENFSETKRQVKKVNRKRKNKGSKGSTNAPKFLKTMDPERSWMWTYGDEERADDEMTSIFEKEKSFNTTLAHTPPFCSVCAIVTDCFDRGEVLEGKKTVDETRRPRFSEPIIPEPAFSKGPQVADYNPKQYCSRASRLLECKLCKIVVHARCYGSLDLDVSIDENKPTDQSQVDYIDNHVFEQWICERCQDDEIRASCCLCPIRGGALKRTSCGRWAHIVCIIACDPINRIKKAVRFGDIPHRTDIIIESPTTSRRRLRCRHCRTNRSGHLASCCYLSCTDGTGCHITCSFLALTHLETGNHPFYFTLTCRRHHDIYERLSRIYARQNLARLEVGSVVLVEDPESHKWCPGKVTSYEKKSEICHLEFPDGQISTDTPTNFVTRVDGADGPMEVGEKVNVLWDDGKTYTASFLRKDCEEYYDVILMKSDKELRVARGDVYGQEEIIPRNIKKKMIGPWPIEVKCDSYKSP